jgi:hypothetical protein
MGIGESSVSRMPAGLQCGRISLTKLVVRQEAEIFRLQGLAGVTTW